MESFVITPHFVRCELNQRREEGCDVSEVEKEVASLDSLPPQEPHARAERLFRKLQPLSPSEDFPYQEPSRLAEIIALRPDGPRSIELPLSEEELLRKTHGAWLGRCVGCMLGKPVEGWPRQRIEQMLRRVDAYPLDNYVPSEAFEGEALDHPWRPYKQITRGGITASARDDDTDYTLLGLHAIETVSGPPTSQEIVREWLEHLPYHRVYSAERAAYRNFVNGILPPESATVVNPFREWIGAQIRADIWGYVCPGEPERAAEMAFQDARISHVKNGMYGEMFVAAALSAAFTTDNLEEIIRVGLSEIPKDSRLAEAVRKTIEWAKQDSAWEETWQRVMDDYGHYHGVHTINNAAVVVLALIHGQRDFTRIISIAVMSGLDADCNGATTGSILGAVLGADAIPSHWSDPLNDTLMTALADMSSARISDLASRTRKMSALISGSA